jgi:hypothetical protein
MLPTTSSTFSQLQSAMCSNPYVIECNAFWFVPSQTKAIPGGGFIKISFSFKDGKH